MLNKDNIGFVNTSLKYSIKEYLPLAQRILLYDMLVFLSIQSQFPMHCSSADIEAFKELLTACKETKIDPATYISCCYEYISKYSKPNHRLGVGYFLNDKVLEYAMAHVDYSSTQNLCYTMLLDEILSTEKMLREQISESVTYSDAFFSAFKKKKLSHLFIAYKKFCNSSVLATLELTSYLENYICIMEPFFTFILAKNQIYTPHKIKSWNNSKIEDFKFCPIYFKDRYITNELPESILGNEATRQGTRLHKIFEDILEKYNADKTISLEVVATKYFKSAAFKKLSQDLDVHIPYIKEQFLDSNSTLRSLITEKTEILIEHQMEYTFDSLSFYGTSDLILVTDNKATILDYKSSKLDPKYLSDNNAKYLKQLSLYAQLFKATRPEITDLSATIIYTRGLTHTFTALNESIVQERTATINDISQSLSSGVLKPNTSNCFLCVHPNCKSRKRASIWNEDGTRKNP